MRPAICRAAISESPLRLRFDRHERFSKKLTTELYRLDREQRLQLAEMTCAIGFVIVLVMVPLSFMVGNPSWHPGKFAAIALGLFFFLVYVGVRFRKGEEFAVSLLSPVGNLLVWAIMFYNSGLTSYLAPLVVVPPILATYLSGYRSGLKIAWTSLALIAVMKFLDFAGLMPPPPEGRSSHPVLGPVVLALAVIIGIFLAYRFTTLARQKQQQLEREAEHHKETAENLQKVMLEVESSAKAKTDFLTTMSHELRTPMNGVIGYLDLLLQSELAPDQREQAEVIRKSSEGLLLILNDILDFSKLEEGQIQLDPKDFDLHELIQNVANLLRPLADAKGLILKVKVSDNLPKVVYADELRLRQILTNLLSNAIKFSTQGEVAIDAELGSAANDDLILTFSVSDQGPGIAPEHLPKLFKRFSQVDSSISRRFGGTGLGLAISQELCRLMGGEISVTSELNLGSVFQFRIKALTARGHLQAMPSSTAPAKVRPLRILVAEDNPVNQKLVVALLTKHRHSVALVENGQEVLSIANEEKFDLILMDVQMPIMDGLQATKKLRATGGLNQETPIIALTANVLTGDRAACLDAGMNDFLAKPVRLFELNSAISRWAPSHSRWQ